ncbi:MAG TPA: PilZ domain-containing protein [Candidatus Angelobacter sp.]
MVPRHRNQRSSPRTFVVCPISVSFESSVVHGIVRDISAGGIFLYLNFKLPLHSEISFSLRLREQNVSGTGEVVRIEEPAPGAAIGVAIKISSYDDRVGIPIANHLPT